jgi:hypothetical protein
MERPELEREVLKRLPLKPCEVPIYQRALRLKSTPELEKILEQMKKAGR